MIYIWTPRRVFYTWFSSKSLNGGEKKLQIDFWKQIEKKKIPTTHWINVGICSEKQYKVKYILSLSPRAAIFVCFYKNRLIFFFFLPILFASGVKHWQFVFFSCKNFVFIDYWESVKGNFSKRISKWFLSSYRKW